MGISMRSAEQFSMIVYLDDIQQYFERELRATDTHEEPERHRELSRLKEEVEFLAKISRGEEPRCFEDSPH